MFDDSFIVGCRCMDIIELPNVDIFLLLVGC